MRFAWTTLLTCGPILVHAQSIDLRAGLPNWGIDTAISYYLPERPDAPLTVVGEHWQWDLDSVYWVLEGERVDTVWHHSETISPAQGGAFSVYDQAYQRYTFYHLNADTSVEDSAWVISHGTPEVGAPPVPHCWQGQVLGDTLRYFDELALMDRITTLRATLDLKTPWGTLTGLVVFEDRILDFITYRIHRRHDLVRELASYKPGDGLYLAWPITERAATSSGP